MIDFTNHNILAVDDEPDNLLVFQSTLEMLHNATVRIAHSAEEAHKVMEDFTPTLIVTDLSMPTVDGYQFRQQLREKPQYNSVPIIALTAHAMTKDKEKVMGAGFDGYITKPFDVTTIAEELMKCVEGYKKKRSTQEMNTVGSKTENTSATPEQSVATSAETGKTVTIKSAQVVHKPPASSNS